MRYFSRLDAQGNEVQGVGCYGPDQLDTPPQGHQWVEVPDIKQYYAVLVNGKPSVVKRVQPLEMAQVMKWTDAKAYRESVRNSTCVTPLGRIQKDEASQGRIGEQAASARSWVTSNQLAALGVKVAVGTWSVDWTMADNTKVTHNATQFIALHDAMIAHNRACQTASEAIRAQIFSATSPDAVTAIDITAGYPKT